MTTIGEPVRLSSYGETIRYEDAIVDLGAVDDETLAYLHEEFTGYLARNFYYMSFERDMDEDALSNIEWEIDYRLKHGEVITEDLPRAWRCGIGCCDD